MLGNNRGDVWDSGKTVSSSSINVPYQGKTLSPNQTYFWKVKTWTEKSGASSWSRPQQFVTAKTLGTYSTPGYSVVKRDVAPSEFIKKADGHYFVDFGPGSGGNGSPDSDIPIGWTCCYASPRRRRLQRLTLSTASQAEQSVTLKSSFPSTQGTHTYLVTIPKYKHGKRTLKMPEDVGEVMPFRYCEITGVPGPFDQRSIQQVAVNYPFDDGCKRVLIIRSNT